MAKVTKQQRKILDRLIYPEPFENVLSETGIKPGELRDELIQLVNHGYVEVWKNEQNWSHKIRFFDTDNMQLCNFRATKSGLKQI